MNEGFYYVVDIDHMRGDGTLYLSSNPDGKAPVSTDVGQYGLRYWPWNGNHDITKVVVEDRIVPTTCESMFDTCDGLASIEGLENLDTSRVTDMYSMFRSCKSLKSLDMSGWDTSKVRDMSNMFRYCASLESLDVSSFDTSKVRDMSNMFGWCDSLKSVTTNDERIICMVPDGTKAVEPTACAGRDATPSLGDTLDQFSATADSLQAAVTAPQGNIADMRETIGHDPR